MYRIPRTGNTVRELLQLRVLRKDSLAGLRADGGKEQWKRWTCVIRICFYSGYLIMYRLLRTRNTVRAVGGRSKATAMAEGGWPGGEQVSKACAVHGRRKGSTHEGLSCRLQRCRRRCNRTVGSRWQVCGTLRSTCTTHAVLRRHMVHNGVPSNPPSTGLCGLQRSTDSSGQHFDI
jgi:hypothetical protein